MKRWLTLLLIVLASVALVAVPVWLIKPFSPQTPRALEFFRKPDTTQLRLVDSETGSEWDFTGAATSGAHAGRQPK